MNGLLTLQSWSTSLAALAARVRPCELREMTGGFTAAATILAARLRETGSGLEAANRLATVVADDPDRVFAPGEAARILTNLDITTQARLAALINPGLAGCLTRQATRFATHCPEVRVPARHELERSWAVLVDVTPLLVERLLQTYRDWIENRFPHRPEAWQAKLQPLKAELRALQENLNRMGQGNLRLLGRDTAPYRQILDRLEQILQWIDADPDNPFLRHTIPPLLAQLQQALEG